MGTAGDYVLCLVLFDPYEELFGSIDERGGRLYSSFCRLAVSYFSEIILLAFTEGGRMLLAN